MNAQEAQALATYICDTWPITPKHWIWTEALLPMNHMDARAAYTRLRRNRHERDMTIGIFSDEYRAQRPPPADEPNECDHCAGDGWHVISYPHSHYRGVYPCEHCPAGKRNIRAHTTVLRTNAAERRTA